MGHAAGVTHLCFGLVACLLLFAAAGPIATDDLWWHLELGELYRNAGPWLAIDPRLHTALGPPAPNAWLFDLGLASLVDLGGLFALRGLHALLVSLCLVLVWRALARRSESALIASLGCAVFIACSTYRLLQLRPELTTILATLVLYTLILEPAAPSWRRVAGSTLLCGLWANLHPGFLLGPVLLFATAAAVRGAAGLANRDAASPERARSMRLCAAGVTGLLATGLNPDGFSALAAYGSAGVAAAGAGLVIDEWRPLTMLAWPQSNLPPMPLAWLCLWLLLPATLWVAAGDLIGRLPSRFARSKLAPQDAIDPGLLALAAIGWLAPFVAMRFIWLCLFPLLLLAAWWPASRARWATRGPWLGAIAALLLLGAYVEFSAWSLLAPRMERGAYAAAYDADRYYAHSVWFLRDSGVEGRLFNAYFMGGFLEYWLAPKLEAFADGSLNFPDTVLRDHALILTYGAGQSGFDLESQLDRYAIDFFVGIGLPTPARPGRPWRYSTHHLERSPKWIPVYRGLRSAIYLRRADRNRANLDRIATYYRGAGVPFDRDRGLDVAAALDRATTWSIDHGLAPIDLPELVAASEQAKPRLRSIARRRLASTYAALGLYRPAIAIDSQTDPTPLGSGSDPGRERRLAWSLMRLDLASQALAHAKRIPSAKTESPPPLLRAVRDYLATASDLERARIAAITPVFSWREAGQLKRVERPARARLR